jgi:signal transduction histidine kinase
LVDTLVERYGGTVEITDNEPRGTTVEVALRRVNA